MQQKTTVSITQRIGLIQAIIFFVCAVFVARLFYLQIIKYDYYSSAAQESQLKRYEIPPERGKIMAFDGNEQVPLVLNEIRYNIVADPQIITEKDKTAVHLASLLNMDIREIQEKLSRTNSRYEIIAKKQTKQVKDELEKLMANGEVQATFAEKAVQRVYPQGNLASQLLGFVNDDGLGNYGIEESLDDQLTGTPGKVKALTDQSGVPLLASGENVLEDPVDGETITLTIHVAMQKQIEKILEEGLKNAKSDSGSIIVMNPNNGHIEAMANFPTYDPAKYQEVKDPLVYNNATVSSPLEPGSIMKTLTVAAALDSGTVTSDTSYFDPGFVQIDDATIRNVEEVAGAGTRSISDILRMSLNTGATYLLKQMGGGEINEKARTLWHDYMTNHYQLGRPTGIEQGFEEAGNIPGPNEGYGLPIRYANSSFGQGITTTPLQMIAAISSIVNGGVYYKPTLVAGHTKPGESFTAAEAEVVKTDVISSGASTEVRAMMQNVVQNNLPSAAREGYIVGGKTGTAQIANPEGGYYEDRFNGTYIGYVGGNKPQYTILVRVNEPKIDGYAGSKAAGPIFSTVANMLMDNFDVASASNN